jgi:hypothetical protein
MKRDIILGFASCALGLMPSLAYPQVTSPVGCQEIVQNSISTGSPGNVPLAVNPGSNRIVLCGYAITMTGSTTAVAGIYSGFGSTCTTQGSLTQTNVSALDVAGLSVSHDGMAAVMPAGASLCLISFSQTSFVSAEINYALQ